MTLTESDAAEMFKCLMFSYFRFVSTVIAVSQSFSAGYVILSPLESLAWTNYLGASFCLLLLTVTPNTDFERLQKCLPLYWPVYKFLQLAMANIVFLVIAIKQLHRLASDQRGHRFHMYFYVPPLLCLALAVKAPSLLHTTVAEHKIFLTRWTQQLESVVLITLVAMAEFIRRRYHTGGPWSNLLPFIASVFVVYWMVMFKKYDGHFNPFHHVSS